jgi:hypothetical protein
MVGSDLQRLSTATDSPAAEEEKSHPHQAVIIPFFLSLAEPS